MSLYAPIDLLDEDSADAASPRSAFGRTVLTLLVILACICAGTALAFKSGAPDRDSTANITISNASEDALYQTIAEESVPGLKLARMQDFLAQYPHSARRDDLSTEITKLSTAEQNAWAELSETLYDLRAGGAAKQAAIDGYSADWSHLFRQARIDAIIGDENAKTAKTSELALTFKTDISRFANMTPEGGLVGAPVYARRNIYQARRASARRAPITAAPKITPISVRTSRSPEYPSRARRRGAQAVITLALDIDKRGRVVQTHVFEVSADDYEKDFIRAAKRAAQRSRFNPKRINGKAVPQDGYVRTYAFKL